ncbi:MAG: TonB-dependent receptor [Acidobacteria bacterium]|nr:TonB-dependent receptor [Acidobacteriota bacterium]
MRIITVLLVALVAVPASAQDTATLAGTVADITGGVLDDVRLEIAGPVRRTAVTGSDGAFQVSALPFGTYRVSAEREGFSTHEETVLLDSARQELSIELPLSPFTQFVETVSRVVEERAQAPFLVTVVDSMELEETAAATLDEALRTVAGLQHGTQGNAYTRVATRGLRDTRDVLVLVDGAPLRQLSGSADLTMVPVPMLEGVEFVKGATSAVYGRSAVGGVMQFFTVPDATEAPMGDVAYRGGSFATHEGRAAVNLPYSGGRFAVTGSTSRSDGHQEDTGRDTSFLSLVNDYSVAGRLNTRLQFLSSDVEAGRGSIVPLENGRPMFGITREENFGIPDARFDGRLHSLTARTDLVASSNVIVTNSFNFNRYARLATGGITIVPPPTVRTKGWWQSDSEQDTFLNDTTLQWTTGTLNFRNTFLAGLGLEWGDEARVSPRFRSGQTFLGPDYVNPVANIQNGPKGIPSGEVTTDYEQQVVSGYVQNRIEAGRVVGTVGLR